MLLACSYKCSNNVLIYKTYNVKYSFEMINYYKKMKINYVKLKPPVGVTKSLLISE